MTTVPELESYQRMTDHKPRQVLSAMPATVISKSFLLTATVITIEGRGKAECVPSLLTLRQQGPWMCTQTSFDLVQRQRLTQQVWGGARDSDISSQLMGDAGPWTTLLSSKHLVQHLVSCLVKRNRLTATAQSSLSDYMGQCGFSSPWCSARHVEDAKKMILPPLLPRLDNSKQYSSGLNPHPEAE